MKVLWAALGTHVGSAELLSSADGPDTGELAYARATRLWYIRSMRHAALYFCATSFFALTPVFACGTDDDAATEDAAAASDSSVDGGNARDAVAETDAGGAAEDASSRDATSSDADEAQDVPTCTPGGRSDCPLARVDVLACDDPECCTDETCCRVHECVAGTCMDACAGGATWFSERLVDEAPVRGHYCGRVSAPGAHVTEDACAAPELYTLVLEPRSGMNHLVLQYAPLDVGGALSF